MTNIDNSTSFLEIVCASAITEIRTMSGDSLRSFQLKNVTEMLAKAKEMYEAKGKPLGTINPKVAVSILENAAYESEEEIQNLWAGLFSSAIAERPNDENLIYSSILKQLSLHEARILKYMIENSKITFTNGGELPKGVGKSLYFKDFSSLTEDGDMSYVQGLLIHMLSLRLNFIHWDHYGEVFRYIKDKNDSVIHLLPTTLALNLYVKCMGYSGSSTDYYKSYQNGL